MKDRQEVICKKKEEMSPHETIAVLGFLKRQLVYYSEKFLPDSLAFNVMDLAIDELVERAKEELNLASDIFSERMGK